MHTWVLRIFAVVTVLFAGIGSAFADWNSFITNFDKSDYGYGMSTWRIATCGRWTYFANQKGMLQFDGTSWKSFPLNNRGEARGVAVFADQNRIYVGGEDEYGYFSAAADGTLSYTCLSDKLGAKFANVGNIFDFYSANGSLYMRGDKYIVVETGGKYHLVTSPNKIFASVMKDGVLYVATDYGVDVLVGRQLVPLRGGEILAGKRINAMVEYDGGIIITTANHGLYFYDGQEVRPFLPAIDAFISRAVICCAAVKGTRLALGTIHNGLILVDMESGAVDRYDERRGLQNNTVISVAFDHLGNIWAGLDYGVDYIRLESAFSYLYRSPKSYGIGYAAMLFEGKLYLGTDRGLFSTPYPVRLDNGDADIRQTDVPSGLTWYLYKAGDELLCLHDKGIFSIRGGILRRVTDISGAWTCQTVAGRKDMMFVGTYNGLYVIRRQDGEWRKLGKVKGIEHPVRYMRQSSRNMVKVYMPNTGKAIQYRLDASLTQVMASTSLNEPYKAAAERSELDKMFVEQNLSENILTIDRSCKIVPYERGFLMFNRSKNNPSSHVVYIQSVGLVREPDSLVYASNFKGLRHEPRIEWGQNSVRIEYNVPHYISPTEVTYRYRINGGQWSEPTTASTKELTDLYEGKYTFEVMATFYDNSTSTDAVTFTVLPPWYRTWVAYVSYLIVLILLAWGTKKLVDRRVELKKRKALVEKNREINRMKIEIDHLEKEKMDMDLMHKSQEIANLMINVTRKNEILQEIKTDIMNVISSGCNVVEARRQLLVINGKVDVNISGDDVIRRFEEEFDIVNNNFTKKLSARFPDLSRQERMLCAYLKMNLSTKDIAPLLNISVRGVETMRYRIRKKMELSREDNLTDFLNNLAAE